MATISNPMQGRQTKDTHPRSADLSYDYRRTVGAYLADVRRKARMTQTEVGRALGWQATMVSAIELGRNNLPPESYEAVAELFGLDKAAFAKFLLRYNNPWLYALTYGKRDASLREDLQSLPDRHYSAKEGNNA